MSGEEGACKLERGGEMKATEVLIAERVGRSDKSRAIIFSQGLRCTFRKCHTPLRAHALTDSTPYTPVQEQRGVASLEGCRAARVEWGTRGVMLQVAFQAQSFQRRNICALFREKKAAKKNIQSIKLGRDPRLRGLTGEMTATRGHRLEWHQPESRGNEPHRQRTNSSWLALPAGSRVCLLRYFRRRIIVNMCNYWDEPNSPLSPHPLGGDAIFRG